MRLEIFTGHNGGPLQRYFAASQDSIISTIPVVDDIRVATGDAFNTLLAVIRSRPSTFREFAILLSIYLFRLPQSNFSR